MKLNHKHFLFVLALFTTEVMADSSYENVPAVPLSVMKQGVPAPMGSKGVGQVNNSSMLTMNPGVNQIIPIAIGHPNRIVTPFENPEVVSTSLSGVSGNEQCGEVCIKENVVYIATDKEYPVTMFITEKGSEAQALSLTMVPRRIPPREVFLRLTGSAMMGGGFINAKADTWEKSQPYIETIRTVFRKIALGEIPQGYSMNNIPPGASVPRCATGSIRVDFSKGQYMMGHNLNVFIGVARNTSNQPIEFKEATCGGWDVAAVTAWPQHVLEPGQKTEIYVAIKQGKGQASTSKRPSLLGAGQ